jgi:hypothetical protein
MKGPKFYDRALVPEHMTKQTLETLPLDEAFYVEPGERDSRDFPAIFVTPDRRLVMSRSHAVDREDAYPPSPYNRVGIMHSMVIDAETGALRDVYLADLRYIEDNELVDINPAAPEIVDQEEQMDLLALVENAVTFDGFIAAEELAEVKKNGSIPGDLYGSPELHDLLHKLRKKGNRRMRRFMELEARPHVSVGDTEKASQSDEPNKSQPTPLAVPFSRGKQ